MHLILLLWENLVSAWALTAEVASGDSAQAWVLAPSLSATQNLPTKILQDHPLASPNIMTA